LVKKADKLGDRVRNRVDFFSEIGAGFVVRRAGKRASAVRPTRASGPASPRLRRDASQLIPLNEEVLVCRKCPLGKIRLHAVPGEGGIDSGLMFVGEAPGAEENAQGRPFVGRAGQLLTNIIKCQPPGNRTPLADEVDACTPYLQRQIAIIQPRAIVALGSVAAGFFVPGGMKISSLRGTFFDYHAVKVMPTYHPSYLVRNQGNRKLKRDVWNDMQKVMALLAKK
jgi:uracil-DNA glycosylase family 4